MLIWRLNGLVDRTIVERSMLPRRGYRRGMKPKHDSKRVYIESLDAPLPGETDNGDPVSLYDRVENPTSAVPGEHLERTDAIRRLLKIAGITQKQAQVLQTYLIEGESQDYAAFLYGVSLRAIRARRDIAIALLRELGKERILDILHGDGDVKVG